MLNRDYRRTAGAIILCLLSVFILTYTSGQTASAGSSMASHAPQWGVDIPVSSPDDTMRDVHRNVSLSINPTNPDNVIAAYERGHSFQGVTAYSWSTDAGRTWDQGSFDGPWYDTEPLTPSGDAHVAFDANGVAYFTGIAFGASTQGYFVLTSTNGINWGTPIPVAVEDNTVGRNRSAFAVDATTGGPYSGSAYLFYMYTSLFAEVPDGEYWRGIWMRYLRDGGRTWSTDIPVTSADERYSYTPSVAIASDGTIYAAFEFLDHFIIDNTPRLFITKSTDGGVTWQQDMPLGDGAASPVGRGDWEGHEFAIVGSINPNFCGLIAIQHYPTIAVSPSDPRTVYATWNDARWESVEDMCGQRGRHSDIAFSRSTDAGQTWSSPQRINDDPLGNGIDQFQPTIAANSDGTLGLTWYDRRFNPGGYFYDLEYSQSTDDGLTWTPNERVSDASNDPDLLSNVKGIDDLGYRHALAFGPDYLLPTWPDAHQESTYGGIYTDRGLTSEPLLTPTSTPTSSVPSSTPTLSPTNTGTAISTATSTPSATATSTVTATPLVCRVAFSDVNPGDYFYDAIQYLYCHGAISGYSDGSFRPYNNTTRGQLSKIAVLAEGWNIDTGGGPHFTDVQTNNPFYEYIETAYNRGVISGYADGTFRWGNNVTRAQLCKIVVNAEGWSIDTGGGPHFRDVPPGDPFYGFVETAYSREVISGYSCGSGCLEFRPGNNATRGQISKIVYNAVTAP